MHDDDTSAPRALKYIDISPGKHIFDACRIAIEMAEAERMSVQFEFNGTSVVASPTDTPEDLAEKWRLDFEAAAKAYRESPEYKLRQERESEELRRKMAASMKDVAVTESEMRDTTVPWPYTMAQLTEYIDSLTERTHDYGTCVYAMSMAATATLNYVAHKLGVSGFQVSCADLDILRRTRHLDGPFILIKAEDGLYPQYNLQEQLAKAMDEWSSWFQEAAKKRLADSPNAHPGVINHWRKLARRADTPVRRETETPG